MLSGLKKIIGNNISQTRKVYLEVNPYLQSPTKALQLIAGLNRPTSINYKKENVFDDLDNIIYSDDFEEICNSVFEYKYTYLFRNEYEIFKNDALSSHDEDWTKIVVGGEFSAGKSSFLNSLLSDEGEIEFLPVSEKPTSVIPTYIYCSNKLKYQYVIGENIHKGKMLLSPQALLALGHEFERKNHISLGTFLNKLTIQQPVKRDFLKDVVFVDTPGYNKEDGESKRDKQTAINAIKTAEVLFWLIDIENGTVKKEDFSFIRENFDKGKPKVIIINKADKWSSKEISNIMLEVEIILKARTDVTIIDIIAYSSHDRQILESYKGNKDWQSIFEKIKSKARKKKAEEDFIEFLKADLEKITRHTASKIAECNEAVKECNRRIIKINNDEDFDISYIRKEINHYYNRSLELKDLCLRLEEVAHNSLSRELDWNKKVGFFENSEDLNKQRKIDLEYLNSYIKVDIEVRDISEDVFERLYNIQNYLREVLKTNIIKDEKKSRENYKNEIDKLKDNLKVFHEKFSSIELKLKKCIRHLNERKSESNFENLLIEGVVNPKGNIFNCITNNDFDGFLACLSVKTEISNLKNNEGLDIVTMAVMHRRYDMVSVLLPKAQHLIDRKGSSGLSAREIAKNNHDHVMINLLTKSSN